MSSTDQPSSFDQGAERQRKLLFVIKAKENSSIGFESFLLNRDWDVVTTSDLKVALSAIFSRPIHCVLITVEHPNPQCMKLPDIIAQTAKIPIILFSEGLTPGGVNILRGSEHPYILAPPVSGPAIERMVLRIEKELFANDISRSDGMSHSRPRIQQTTLIQSSKYSEKDFAYLFESDHADLKSSDFEFGEGKSLNLNDSKTNPNSAGYSSNRSSRVKEFTRLGAKEEASVLDRAATAALKGSVVFNFETDGTLRTLDRRARVACLQVDSAYFAGVIVVAFATDHTNVAEFMESFKTLLMGFLNDEGVATSMFEVPEFCLNDVSFEDWADSDAAFLRKSIHRNGEVGVSFFQHHLNVQPLRKSEDLTMSRFGLQEIREEVALAFDVYLYFPINKKYIRYAAKERFLYDSQRHRLSAGGVEDVHIKRDSEKDVNRYRLQIGLHDKLRAYAEKKGA